VTCQVRFVDEAVANVEDLPIPHSRFPIPDSGVDAVTARMVRSYIDDLDALLWRISACLSSSIRRAVARLIDMETGRWREGHG
jgi:hypothetical protein